MELSEVLDTNRAVVKVAKLYRHVQAGALAELGLHPGQDVLLWTLGGSEQGLTVGEIAAQLGIEPPTVTRSLARLEPGGWFTREPVPGDRRLVRIALTRHGRDVVPRIEAVWRTLADTVTRNMTAAQRSELVALLGIARENLAAIGGGDLRYDEE
jgi:DNA-binding MarR family transcriptional regulator